MTPRMLAASAATACAFACALAAASPAAASQREYWVAAVPTPWTIVPNGQDAIHHQPIDPMRSHIDSTVVYQRFSRGFKRRLRNRTGGLVGPLLRARVGDRVVVHFLNLDTENPHSMHFHAFKYKPSSDGAYLPGFSGKDADVKPGQRYTYRLQAVKSSKGVWPYHDHSPSMEESIAGGMYGVVSVNGRHEPWPDQENVVFFGAMNEFNTIDGRAFVGNTPVFHQTVGDLVQWDVLNLGDDFHTFHPHGHRWMEHGKPRDTKTVGPAESFRIRWREDAPGTWFYHCHVESHMMNGMIGIFRVSSAGAGRPRWRAKRDPS